MKVKNIMFAGFAAAIFAGVAGAANAATYNLASQEYVDAKDTAAAAEFRKADAAMKAEYEAADAAMKAEYEAADAALEAAYKAADGQTLEAARKYADDIVAGEGGISEQVQQNTADIATINASPAMTSGITAAKVQAYDAYATTKQDTLTEAQVAAVDSGITSADVAQIKTNKTDIATNAQNIQSLTDATAVYVGPQAKGDYVIRYGENGEVESLVQITVVDKDGKVMYPAPAAN